MDLKAQLRRDEGVSYTAYKDTLGNWTIGVGHLILPNERDLITTRLADEQVDALLDQDISRTQKELTFDWFLACDPIRQAALTNMAFNIGVSGLLHFPTMLHCIAMKDWSGAKIAALHSVWADQVKGRAQRIAEQIRSGEWV